MSLAGKLPIVAASLALRIAGQQELAVAPGIRPSIARDPQIASDKRRARRVGPGLRRGDETTS